MDAEVDHAGLLRPFLNREMRARFTDLDPGTKQRTRLFNRLCHDWETTLDWRTAQPIPATEQTVESIVPLLRKLGAGKTCYALCASDEWDGLQAPLVEALRGLVGNGLPVLLVCVPGSLAYFEPEYVSGAGRRYCLHRQGSSRE
jgi:hypothetical protein